MKFKAIRRVALRKQYEFTELHAEGIKNLHDARVALLHLEGLADYAREVEVMHIGKRRSKVG